MKTEPEMAGARTPPREQLYLCVMYISHSCIVYWMRATKRRAFKGGSKRRTKNVRPARSAGSNRNRAVKASATSQTKKNKQGLLPLLKSQVIKVKIKKTGNLSPREIQDVDGLITSSFKNSSINYIDKSNDCVFVSIGNQVVGAMFLKLVDGYHENNSYNRNSQSTINSNDEKMRDLTKVTTTATTAKGFEDRHIYIHTVCVSSAHRGKGLLHKLFYFLSTLPQFKHTIFKLEASNTVEHEVGLNQAARFQIYSKAGFTLPVGTVIEPGGETVAGVEMRHRDVAYTLRSRDGQQRVVSFRDVHPEVCYIHSIKQERGCLMQSDSKKMRDFNHA
jgi:hypothetical protein